MSYDEKHSLRPKRNLTSIIIEPFKQIKFGLYVMTISVLFLCLAAVLFVSAFWQQYQHVMEIFQVVDPNNQWELVTNNIFFINALKLGGLFLAYIVILFAIIFRLTHRYYGPLINIERFVTAISDGQYSKRVQIRQGDEMQRLVASLNVMAEQLEKRHSVSTEVHRKSS